MNKYYALGKLEIISKGLEAAIEAVEENEGDELSLRCLNLLQGYLYVDSEFFSSTEIHDAIIEIEQEKENATD